MNEIALMEAASSVYKRKYQCPYCNEKYDRVKLVDHIEKKHSEFIPKDFTASRIVFNIVNKKEKGKCTICGKESPWDEDKCRYDRFCSEKCKKAYEQLAAERLKRVRGMTKQEMLKDPEYQNNVMLANRSISGKYKFQDGTIRTYVGSYEHKFLEFMDKFLNVKSEDLETPGPIIEYKFKGETHKWITDAYYAPYNLAFDIKDGGDNPNKREMPEYRAKQTAKEDAIRKQGKYNYIRLTDNKFEQLIELMLELKELYIENNGEYNPIIRINESVEDGELLDESYIINEIYDKEDDTMNENYLFNKKDIYYNKDKFDSEEINLCFITGHSGSGKSTMARNLQSDNIEHYELDDLQCIKDHFTMDNLKEYGDLIYSYFNGKGKKFYVTYKELVDNNIPGSEYEDILFKDFVHYAMDYAKSNKNKKFIIEGVWILCTGEDGKPWFSPEEFKDYAFCIKGTSMIVSKHRAALRDAKEDSGNNKLDIAKSYLSNFVRKNWKWYFIDEKRINIFRKYFSSKVTTESASILDPDHKTKKTSKKFKYIDLKDQNIENNGEYNPIIRINESTNLLESDSEIEVYRCTYKGEGIYEALRKNIDLETWKSILSSDKINWLPKPPQYKSYKNCRSYFTYKGYKKFSKDVLPIMYKYLDKKYIKIDKLYIYGKPLYQDEYQIVISKELDESTVLESKKAKDLGPKVCSKCGSKNIGVFFQGEPIYKCKDCGEYLGTVPFNESTSNDIIQNAFNSVIHTIKWCRMDDSAFCSINEYSEPKIINDNSFSAGKFAYESGIDAVVKTINDNNIFGNGKYSASCNNNELIITIDKSNSIKEYCVLHDKGYFKLLDKYKDPKYCSWDEEQTYPTIDACIRAEKCFGKDRYCYIMDMDTYSIHYIGKMHISNFEDDGYSVDWLEITDDYPFPRDGINEVRENTEEDCSKSIKESVNINSTQNFNPKLRKDINSIAKKYKSNIQTVNITFVDSKDNLQKYSKYKLDEWVNGFCLDNNVYIIKEEYYDNNSGNYYNLLLHECTHAIINNLNPKCDMDFIEGICVYESGQFDEFKNYNGSFVQSAAEIKDIIDEKGYDYIIDYIKSGKNKSIKEFSIITPSSDKPSQEGFIGHGSWNAIKKVNGEPYRERVEVIIFNKELDKVLIGTKKSDGSVKLPGGGTDKNSSLESQAAKECQEEVKVNIDNLKYIGSYSMPNKQTGYKNDVYKGQYTYLYLATYDSDYTGYIRPEDLDSLYGTAEWMSIYDAKKLLKKRSVDLYNLFNYNYKLYINDLSYLKL